MGRAPAERLAHRMLDIEGMSNSNAQEMSSSEVRDAILAQHEMIRTLLNKTIELADRESSSDGDIEELDWQVSTLYETLATHMDFEERALPAALRDVIGWGPVLQAQLEADHASQRATLALAIEALAEPSRGPRAALISGIRSFASALLADMEREERGLLQADLDAIVTDTPGG